MFRSRIKYREVSEIGIRYQTDDKSVYFVDPYLDPLPTNPYCQLKNIGAEQNAPFYTLNRLLTILNSDHYVGIKTPYEAQKEIEELKAGDFFVYYNSKMQDFEVCAKEERSKTQHIFFISSLYMRPPANLMQYMSRATSSHVGQFLASLNLEELPPISINDSSTAASAASASNNSMEETACNQSPESAATTMASTAGPIKRKTSQSSKRNFFGLLFSTRFSSLETDAPPRNLTSPKNTNL